LNAESASCLDGKKGKEYIGVRNELLTPHRDTGNKLIPVLTAWGDLTASQAYSTLLISLFDLAYLEDYCSAVCISYGVGALNVGLGFIFLVL